MKKRMLAALVLVGMLVAGWLLLRAPETQQPRLYPGAGESQPLPGADGRVNTGSEAAPGTKPGTHAAGNAVPARSPVVALMLSNNDYWTALQKIDQMAEVPLGERLFFKGVILETCADYRKAPGNEQVLQAVEEGTLPALLARSTSLMKDERQKAAMVYKLERNIAVGCKGFGDRATQADAEKAFAAAAAAGDPRALARQVNKRQAESSIANAPSAKEMAELGASGIKAGPPDPLTPNERAVLLDALFTGDPVAIMTAGHALSIGGPRQTLLIGPDAAELPAAHTDEVWALVACEFGFECAARNMMVNVACAESRLCADDYASYLRNYVMTPHEYAAVEASAQAIADAIRRRDAPAFQLAERQSRYMVILAGGPARIRIR